MKFLKQYRLVSERDFVSLLKKAHLPSGKGPRRILSLGIFKIYRDPEAEQPRLGLAVSSKLVRKSVERNRIKRCVREFFRLNRPQLQGDYLIKVQRRPEQWSCPELTTPLKTLFVRSSSSGSRL